jgi:hypothetical protein
MKHQVNSNSRVFDQYTPGNTRPAAACVRGRHLVCPISAATDVSLQEC